jgi:heme/copper-type cytochrome/quinol oxidase subunit 2
MTSEEESLMGAPTDPPGAQRLERSGGTAPPGVPRWVKVLGAVVVGLLLLALVLQVTGVAGGHGPGRHGRQPHGEVGGEVDTPPIDGAPVLAVTAQRLAFEPEAVALTVGAPVNVALTSDDMLHDLIVDEGGFHVAAGRGETATGGLVFDDPGTYVGYCTVAGHREAGMELQLVVVEQDEGHTPPVEH